MTDRRFSFNEFVWVALDGETHYGRIIGYEHVRSRYTDSEEWHYAVRIYGTGGRVIGERVVTEDKLRRPTEMAVPA